METKQAHAVSLKKGSYVLFDGKPAIVKSVQTSRPGKHGHAKCRIEAIGIMDSKKIVKVYPGHDFVEVPIIDKKSAQVLSISGDKANIMDSETYETFDVDIDQEIKEQVKEGSNVVYWEMGTIRIIKQVK